MFEELKKYNRERIKEETYYSEDHIQKIKLHAEDIELVSLVEIMNQQLKDLTLRINKLELGVKKK